jgi:hypothetical protein
LVTEATDSSVHVTTLAGKEILVTWGERELVDSWEGSFSVTAPPGSLRIEGGEKFEIEALAEPMKKSG